MLYQTTFKWEKVIGKIQKLVELLKLLAFIGRPSFYTSVPSFHILSRYIENLKALKLHLRTLTTQTKKKVRGIYNFYNLSIAMASNVTHIYFAVQVNVHNIIILMSKLERKTGKQMTEISKIPYIDMKIYPSCWKFCEILLEQ